MHLSNTFTTVLHSEVKVGKHVLAFTLPSSEYASEKISVSRRGEKMLRVGFGKIEKICFQVML